MQGQVSDAGLVFDASQVFEAISWVLGLWVLESLGAVGPWVLVSLCGSDDDDGDDDDGDAIYGDVERVRIQILRSGTGMHLSEQRRCSSAHGRWASHGPKLSLENFVSCAPVTQQAEKRHCSHSGA